MTGLNLETFLRLLRADVGAWASLGAIVLLLGLMAWTSWGSRKALRKCLMLSILAHVGLVFYGGAELSNVIATAESDDDLSDEPGIREIRITPPPGGGGAGGSVAGRPGTTGRGGTPAPAWDRLAPDLPAPVDPDLVAVAPRPEPVAPEPLELPPIDPDEVVALADARPEVDPSLPEIAEPRDAPEPVEPEPAGTIAPVPVDPSEVVADLPGPGPEATAEPAPLALPEPDRLASRPMPGPAVDDLRPRLRPIGDPVATAEAAIDEPAPLPRPDDRPARPEAGDAPEVAASRADAEAVPDARPVAADPARAVADLPDPGDLRDRARPSTDRAGMAPLERRSAAPAALPDPVADAGLAAVRPGDRPAIDEPAGAPPAGPSPGDDGAIAAVEARRPTAPAPTMAAPEADLRVAARPTSTAGRPLLAFDRVSGLPAPDLGRVVPGGLPDLPDVPGTSGGRPLADVPEVYRPRLDPNRSLLARRAGASDASEQAVERALDWLARHQDADGRWDAGTARYRDGSAAPGDDSFTAHCPAGDICFGECFYWEADTAVTGLALLAFLGAGYTQADGRYQRVVGRGLDFLVASQKPDGDLRGPSKAVGMYCHAMATLALSEAYALTGDPKLRGPVERAVRFLAEAQYPGLLGWRYAPSDEITRKPAEGSRGWSYEPHPPVGDTSVLGWVVMVLKSAREVGVDVPASAERSATELARPRRRRRLRRPGPLSALPAGRPGDDRRGLGLPPVPRRRRPGRRPAPRRPSSCSTTCRRPTRFNVYYWYYGTLAMYQAGGPAWQRWNAAVRDTLVNLQRRDGHKAGSWDPDPTRYGTHGGRVYATALAALTLEVYYRYLRLYDAAATASGAPPLAPSPARPGDAAVRRAGGELPRD